MRVTMFGAGFFVGFLLFDLALFLPGPLHRDVQVVLAVCSFVALLACLAEAGRQRAERRNPACPRCGRRNAVKGYRPGARKATFYCDPDRSIGGCGTEFEAT